MKIPIDITEGSFAGIPTDILRGIHGEIHGAISLRLHKKNLWIVPAGISKGISREISGGFVREIT